MDKSYLFFDIECANCFDGVGKMCSFGYVLTDRYFNVLDTDDVVMNPECEFDWYLFSPKNQCPLAYSKDYFRAQHNFESFYKPLKKLIEESERRVIGFASPNDLGFVVSACERYDLPYINFAAYDIKPILENTKDEKHKLSEWCQKYAVRTDDIQAHKSQDDAMMTMRLTKAFCEEQGIEIEELLEKNRGVKLSVDKYLEAREAKRHNEEIAGELKQLYGKKCRARLSEKLAGKEFAFGYKIFSTPEDADTALELAQLVFKHSGVLQKHLKNRGTLIVQDDTEPAALEGMKKKGFEVITETQLRELCNMEKKRR